MQQFDTVKVFTATKARERESLGEKVTEWIRGFEGKIVDREVTQSSDNEFHCLTVTLFMQSDKNGRGGKRRRSGNR